MLTDMLIADHSDAEAMVNSLYPLDAWQGIAIKGIDLVKMVCLYDILIDCGFDTALNKFGELAGKDDGPWVFQTPQDFGEALVAILDIDVVSLQWASIEEFGFDDWATSDAVKQVLVNIIQLATKAKEIEKPLVMWMAL